MSRNSYVVIFELTPATGGSAYLRTRTDYESKEQFQAQHQPSDQIRVAIEGIAEGEANVFLCMTPVISYYTHAIEEVCYNGAPDWNLLEFHMTNAKFFSEEHLLLRQSLQVAYSMPDGFEIHLAKLAAGSDPKSRLMRAMINAYDPDTDMMNHDMAEIYLFQAISDLTGSDFS